MSRWVKLGTITRGPDGAWLAEYNNPTHDENDDHQAYISRSRAVASQREWVAEWTEKPPRFRWETKTLCWVEVFLSNEAADAIETLNKADVEW